MFSGPGKVTTQTWSKSAQESAIKNEKVNRVGADVNNPFGDKKLGEIANEIADPGWVDTSKKIRETSQTLDKDAFLKLMLTQMKNQDPTSPLESHEMAAQLAQFTSLEQLFNVNKNLEGLAKSNEPKAGFEAVGFIGKTISSDSSRIIRAEGDSTHQLRFNLGSDASEIQILVQDLNGQTVKKFQLGDMKKGVNEVTWNGLNEDSLQARPGEYRFVVDAKGSNGRKVGVATEVKGKITGVNFTKTGPILLVGNQSVPLSEVRKIEDPDLKEAEEAKVPAANLGKPTTGSVAPGAAPALAPAPSQIMNDVPMASGLKNQIDKATKG